MNFPKDLRYTKDHEWAKVDGKQVIVGITDHGQQALGDVVYVELPAVGRTLKAGETFGVVESIKAVSDLYSPVSGKVTAVNSSLSDAPDEVNKDPYAAWIVKVEISDPASAESLMNADAYTKFVQTLK